MRRRSRALSSAALPEAETSNAGSPRWELAAALSTVVVSMFAAGLIDAAAADLDRRVALQQPDIDELLAQRLRLQRASGDDVADAPALAQARLGAIDWSGLFPGRRVAVRERGDTWLLSLDTAVAECERAR